MHLEVDSLRQLSAGAETGEAILLRRVARLEASHAPPTLVVRDHEKLDVRVCLAVDERAALLALVARASRRVRCRRRVRRPRDLDAARSRSEIDGSVLVRERRSVSFLCDLVPASESRLPVLRVRVEPSAAVPHLARSIRKA